MEHAAGIYLARDDSGIAGKFADCQSLAICAYCIFLFRSTKRPQTFLHKGIRFVARKTPSVIHWLPRGCWFGNRSLHVRDKFVVGVVFVRLHSLKNDLELVSLCGDGD